MAEARYGRLFTEADVVRIVNAATGDRPDEPFDIDAAIDPATLTFPADEPLFLLRGHDAYAPNAVGDYLARLNTSLEHRLAVETAEDAMRDWQVRNPDRVKVPD